MVGILLALALSICQSNWDLSEQSEYVNFKDSKTYVISSQDCIPTPKKKYVPPPPPPQVVKKPEPKCVPTIIEESKVGAVIYFDYASSKLKKTEIEKLDKMVADENFELVKIVGCTCDLGKFESNKKLAQKRAEAIAKYLESLGVEDITIDSDSCILKEKPKDSREKYRKAIVYITDFHEECVFPDKYQPIPEKPQFDKKGQDRIGNIEMDIDDEELKELLEQHPELKNLIKRGK